MSESTDGGDAILEMRHIVKMDSPLRIARQAR